MSVSGDGYGDGLDAGLINMFKWSVVEDLAFISSSTTLLSPTQDRVPADEVDGILTRVCDIKSCRIFGSACLSVMHWPYDNICWADAVVGRAVVAGWKHAT